MPENDTAVKQFLVFLTILVSRKFFYERIFFNFNGSSIYGFLKNSFFAYLAQLEVTPTFVQWGAICKKSNSLPDILASPEKKNS